MERKEVGFRWFLEVRPHNQLPKFFFVLLYTHASLTLFLNKYSLKSFRVCFSVKLSIIKFLLSFLSRRASLHWQVNWPKLHIYVFYISFLLPYLCYRAS